MNFVSFGFAVLFAFVLLVRVTIGRTKQHPVYLVVLLAASLFFYAWHVPGYLLLLLASIVVDYLAGLGIGWHGATPRLRRLLLVLSLATNLGLLAVFKYADFALERLHALLAGVGVEAEPQSLGWALPIGISFYTFQSLSYTIDVYRGLLPPMRSLWKFALFVSFFPQLVAGPIVRAKDFLYQIDRRRGLHLAAIQEGLWLMIQGFFLKLVVSNQIGPVVDAYWDRAAQPGAGGALVLLVAALFGFQIYADFAGYSNIARGCGYLLGFRLPVNFASPFIATSIREFWNRWHISLSTWLRDYLYIPLGGNRGGNLRTSVNLALVMLLSGLWHGAAAHYVAWGGLHGAVFVIERWLGLDGRAPRARSVELAWGAVVQLVVVLSWLVFRATDLGQTGALFANLTNGPFRLPDTLPLGWALLVVSPVVVAHLRTLATERLGLAPPGIAERAFVAGVCLYLCLTANGVNDAFIYFQF